MFGTVHLRDAVGLFMGEKVFKTKNEYIDEERNVTKVEAEKNLNQHGWELQKYRMAQEPTRDDLTSLAKTYLPNPSKWTMLGPPTSADLT